MLAHSRIAVILPTQSSMNDWPPNPGWTVMTRAMSASSRYGNTSSTGVSGFSDMPTLSPFLSILFMAAWMSPVASQCTVMQSHPAAAKSSMYLAGSWIIRWASNGMSEYFLMDLMTGAPKVMLGTNIPSMTSRCAQSAPAFSMRRSSSPNLEKSAESMDGDTLVIADHMPVSRT